MVAGRADGLAAINAVHERVVGLAVHLLQVLPVRVHDLLVIVVDLERLGAENSGRVLQPIAQEIIDGFGVIVEIDEHQAQAYRRPDLAQAHVLGAAAGALVGFVARHRDAVPLRIVHP